MNNIKRTIYFLKKAGGIKIVIITIITITFGFYSSALLWIDKTIVDTIVNNTQISWNKTMANYLLLLSIIWFLVRYLYSAFSSIKNMLAKLIEEKLKKIIANEVMQKSYNIEYEYFEKCEFYNKIEATKSSQGNEPLLIFDNLIKIISETINIVIISILLYKFSLVAVIVTILCCLPGLVYTYIYRKQNCKLTTDKIPEIRKMNYLFKLVTMREPAKENMLLNTRKYYIERYINYFNRYFKIVKDFNIKKNGISIILAFIHTVGVMGVICTVFYYAAKGKISLGEMTLYVGAAGSLYNAVHNISFYIDSFLSAIFSSKHLFDFLNIQINKEKVSSDEPFNLQDFNFEHDNTIEFINVRFKYPGSDVEVLKGISFVIKNGEKVALVGENGEGKTTIIKLILGLYKATSGKILINGVNIDSIPKDILQKKFAVCFQDFFNYSLTFKQCIGIGNINDIENLEKINTAAKNGDIFNVIEKSQDKYNTYIGKEFSRDGVVLSGGQSQKLALARAFMGDGDILILDEPSAALDVETEHLVFEKSLNLAKNKTCIFITHRLSNVSISDKVILIKDGIVIEEGSHKELLHLNGKYSTLFNIQAKAYKVANS